MIEKKVRVVVTGMGAVTPLGLNVEESWTGLVEARSGISVLEPEIHPTVKVGGQIKNFDLSEILRARVADRKRAKELLQGYSLMHRSVQFSLVAVHEALSEAGFLDEQARLSGIDQDKIAAVIGTGEGGATSEAGRMQKSFSEGTKLEDRGFILRLLPERVDTVPSMKWGIYGPTFSVAAACATGPVSVQVGRMLIENRHNPMDVVLVGGTEAALDRIGLTSFEIIGALSKNNDPKSASRPFDKEADGFVMGEGAGVLVLEELGHALKRGVKIHAELVGYGQASDGKYATDPDGIGARKTMRLALKDAGIEPEEVDYINAHGTSTPVGDPVELEAIAEVFENNLDELLVSSTKGAEGHLLGAAGGKEAIETIETIEQQLVPPTLNIKDPIRDDIDLVANYARRRRIDIAMSNSFGFGGINVSLIFKRFEG